MNLNDATKMAQEDANKYQININIIYDELSEDNEKYGFCSEDMMEFFHPEIHKDFWRIVDVVSPNKLAKVK